MVKCSLALQVNCPTALLEDTGQHWEEQPGLPHALHLPQGTLPTRSACLPQ